MQIRVMPIMAKNTVDPELTRLSLQLEGVCLR